MVIFAFEMNNITPVLTIAGSDCSGGAGIQADIKTISALGCYAMSVITAITAQNTVDVRYVEGVQPQVVSHQIRSVMDDIVPAAIKTGMLLRQDVVQTVATHLRRCNGIPIVIDPVMFSTSGHQLLECDAIEAVKTELFPLAAVVTPNVYEAQWLSGCKEPHKQGEALLAMGCRAVLLKGGDRDSGLVKADLLMDCCGNVVEYKSPTVVTENTHGTGCTLSSAIACYLAKGENLPQSIDLAKKYIDGALRANADVRIGNGHGPVGHFWNC